jgi:quercetin dioxygenase-like cupin family protein
MNPVASSGLPYVKISSPDDPTINWEGAFACYGGNGANNTVVVPFAIQPGGHLGWHTDSLEETQYIIAGQGEFQRDDGTWNVGPGDIFLVEANVRHDLKNTGQEPLTAIAFFSGAAIVQKFDSTMLPPNGHVLQSPNAG